MNTEADRINQSQTDQAAFRVHATTRRIGAVVAEKIDGQWQPVSHYKTINAAKRANRGKANQPYYSE